MGWSRRMFFCCLAGKMEDRGAAMILVRQILVVLIVTSIFSLSSAAGDQVRYYQENGITYCETRRTVQRPVCETTMQQSTRTVYKEQYYTDTKDVTRVYWCPVTTYRADTYWIGRWNPFVEPYLETQWAPQTCWQQRTEELYALAGEVARKLAAAGGRKQ